MTGLGFRTWLLGLGLIAGNAAADSVILPEGCEAFLTVQRQSCSISYHFRCDSDPDGHSRRTMVYANGIVTTGIVDSEFQLVGQFRNELDPHTRRIGSFSPAGGSFEMMTTVPVDRFRISDMFSNGSDTFDYEMQRNMRDVVRYYGVETLTGAMVDIDGVQLHEVTSELHSEFLGYEDSLYAATSYYSQNWGLGFVGETVLTRDGHSTNHDITPVEFILPGEPGFLASSAKYGCVNS